MGLLGAHVSISGGVDLAPERAHNLKCEAMQIFTRNQMQWKARKIDDDEAERFSDNLKKFKILKTMAHDSYLINLAAKDEKTLGMSKDTFIDEIKRARLLDIDFLIFHPGAHLGVGEEQGMKKIADNVRRSIEKTGKGKPRVLFETTAGQGSNLGYSFEQIGKMLELVGMPDMIGVCYDTCHSYAAGYDITTESSYEETFERFDEVIGLDMLFAFHVNDSKGGLGSRLDRHSNIGEGNLGKMAFSYLVNDRRFSRHPMILETPGGDAAYEKDLRVLRSLKRKGAKQVR
ncbi:MAG TPA: deoxyribonuclease IV [Euryarchaeota archaeon]|nr:deoxyribonuclease IV [Euryarchaeota archaeon]